MKLYIDESGNTGETLSKDSRFNFEEQPYYVLAGIILDEKGRIDLESFLSNKVIKYKVQGNELKAKNLYESKPSFIIELVDYINDNKIPFFIELMDKQFYLSIQIIEYFLVPYYSLPVSDENNFLKKMLASNLSQFLNSSVYQNFTDAVKRATNESLEEFYDVLINHFVNTDNNEMKINVEQTKIDYFEAKEINPGKALKDFFPLPDENPNKRLIHLLPNFNAFTNMIARAQMYKNKNRSGTEFEIIHDEQKQFDVIFQSALEQMKNADADSFIENTLVADKATFNIDKSLKLSFEDSKSNLAIQVSDLIAGVVMRFWIDFVAKNQNKVDTYLPVIKKLSFPSDVQNGGINYVVPDYDHNKIMMWLNRK